jgi:hypothetical protein
MKIENTFNGDKKDLIAFNKVVTLGYFTKIELDKIVEDGDITLYLINNKKLLSKTELMEAYKKK